MLNPSPLPHHRRAQTSLESLFPYGWVFLVIVVVLSAIAYIGLFTPGRFAAESCQLGDRLQCVDALLTGTTDGSPGTLVVKIYNGYERSMVVDSAVGNVVPLKDCVRVTIRPGAVDDLSCEIPQSPVIGEKPQLTFTVKYRPEGFLGDFYFNLTGAVRAKVLAASTLQTCAARGLHLCDYPATCPYGWEAFNFEPGACCTPTCLAAPQCSNGIDDDNDLCIDVGSDDDCLSAQDPIEAGSTCYPPTAPPQGQCAAAGGQCCPGTCLTAPNRRFWGGCDSPDDCCPITYGNLCQPNPECEDGTDNDADLLIDYPADPDCLSKADGDEGA